MNSFRPIFILKGIAPSPFALGIIAAILPLQTGCLHHCTGIGPAQGLDLEITSPELEDGDYQIILELENDTREKMDPQDSLVFNCSLTVGVSSCTLPAQLIGDSEVNSHAWLSSEGKIDVTLWDFHPTELSLTLLRNDRELGTTMISNIEYEYSQPNGAKCDGKSFKYAYVMGAMDFEHQKYTFNAYDSPRPGFRELRK